METFFTSDQHFGHINIIKYCNRPFDSLDEMNETLIENHNKMVTNKDIVYHLGDFSFKQSPSKWLDRLNGKEHHLILGNHDFHKLKSLEMVFDSVQNVKMIKVGSDSVFLSHYAHLVWPQKHYGVYHLFGHSHGSVKGELGSLDCGVDCHGYMPIPWEDLKNVIDNEKKMIKNIDLF